MHEVIIQPSTQDTYADENDKTTVKGALTFYGLRNSTDKNQLAYVKFDLSTLVGKTIISAVFWGKILSENTPGPPHPTSVDIKRCTEAWDEATLDWAPQPGVSGVVMSTAGWREGLGWKDWTFDLDEFALMIGTNHGFRIKCEPVDQGGNDWQTYASSENGTAADRPKLVVNYEGNGGKSHSRRQFMGLI